MACLALDVENKNLRFYEGGHLRIKEMKAWNMMDILKETKPLNLTGMLLGSQLQFRDRQMHASYTSVNIFSRFLSDKEMSDITGCKEDPNGDYLAWNETKWKLSGESAFAKNISSDIVCKPRNGTTIFFPSKHALQVEGKIQHRKVDTKAERLWETAKPMM